MRSARLESSVVDLVLSDVVMPDLDGYQLFQEVSRRYPGLPVVLMTAFHFDKDHIIKRSARPASRTSSTRKPIDPPRLREIIKRQRAARAGGRGLMPGATAAATAAYRAAHADLPGRTPPPSTASPVGSIAWERISARRTTGSTAARAGDRRRVNSGCNLLDTAIN